MFLYKIFFIQKSDPRNVSIWLSPRKMASAKRRVNCVRVKWADQYHQRFVSDLLAWWTASTWVEKNVVEKIFVQKIIVECRETVHCRIMITNNGQSFVKNGNQLVSAAGRVPVDVGSRRRACWGGSEQRGTDQGGNWVFTWGSHLCTASSCLGVCHRIAVLDVLLMVGWNCELKRSKIRRSNLVLRLFGQIIVWVTFVFPV